MRRILLILPIALLGCSPQSPVVTVQPPSPPVGNGITVHDPRTSDTEVWVVTLEGHRYVVAVCGRGGVAICPEPETKPEKP